MIRILNEMAMAQSDAIEICMSLGKKFIEHYAKVREDQKSGSDDNLRHHIVEMQTWWDKVRKIYLKKNNKIITHINLSDWFFSVGSSIEEFLPNEYCEGYNDLMIKMLNDRDKRIAEILGYDF